MVRPAHANVPGHPEKTHSPERSGFPPFDANPFESRGFRDIAGGSRRGDNPQYQLTKAEYPAPTPFNGEIHSWTYDAIGNRLTDTVNGTPQTYTYLKNGQNPLNGQKLANDGTNAYTYDFNGNTLTRTGYGFGYDAENRLTSISGNETATYTYDYQGRRTSKTVAGVTTTYLYDGLNLIAETTAGQTSYFLNGAGIDEPLAMSKAGQISYMSSDGLGSVVATNDPTGTVTHSVVFDAWGNTKSELGTRQHPFTYTGREVGEAGLLHYRARQYQPSIGRFGSEDPLGGEAQVGLFTYVGNRPLHYWDPSGLAFVTFNRAAGLITVWSLQGRRDFPASNTPANASHPISGVQTEPLRCGTCLRFLPQDRQRPHRHPGRTDRRGIPSDSADGEYGMMGIFRFEPYSDRFGGHNGVGLHSGRANRGGYLHPTLGCVRTTDEGMAYLAAVASAEPLTFFAVDNDDRVDSSPLSRFGPTGAAPYPADSEFFRTLMR